MSRWQYSGESDLVLTNARCRDEKSNYLDFRTAIACRLKTMQKDETITSVGAYFEAIGRYTESGEVDGAVRPMREPVHCEFANPRTNGSARAVLCDTGIVLPSVSMKHLLILAVHLLATIAKLLRRAEYAVVAESSLLKHQLLVNNRVVRSRCKYR
jgi:hypothetical protein